MTAVGYGEIEDRALRTRARLGLGLGPVHDIEAALKQAGLLVLVAHLGKSGPEGLYVRRADYGAVLLNGDAFRPRARFTAAHELGHHELGHDAAVDEAIAENSNDPAERPANVFAAEFLVPKAALVRLASAGRPRTPQAVSELARRFGVSYLVLVYRLHNTGLLPGGATERDWLVGHQPLQLHPGRYLNAREAAHFPDTYVELIRAATASEEISTDRARELLEMAIKAQVDR